MAFAQRGNDKPTTRNLAADGPIEPLGLKASRPLYIYELKAVGAPLQRLAWRS